MAMIWISIASIAAVIALYFFRKRKLAKAALIVADEIAKKTPNKIDDAVVDILKDIE